MRGRCAAQVGTYIGERLLYAPSVGYCLLLADALARLAGPERLPGVLLLWEAHPAKRALHHCLKP